MRLLALFLLGGLLLGWSDVEGAAVEMDTVTPKCALAISVAIDKYREIGDSEKLIHDVFVSRFSKVVCYQRNEHLLVTFLPPTGSRGGGFTVEFDDQSVEILRWWPSI